MKFLRNKGFTLAEILVTLGIIGVIASMTIPNLVQDIQDVQLKTAWKKAYSELDQANKRVLLDNAGNIKNICSSYSHDCLRNLYRPVFNYVKSCNTSYAPGNCWHNFGNFSFLSGTSITQPNIQWASDSSALILDSGCLIEFWYGDCPGTACGIISVDVNGFKKPNIIGKDIFRVSVREDGIKPSGSQGDGNEDSCKSTDSGYGCSAKYLYQ